MRYQRVVAVISALAGGLTAVAAAAGVFLRGSSSRRL